MFGKIKKSLYQISKALALKFVAPYAEKRISQKIMSEKDPNTLVFLSYFGMGDLLYCLSFLKEIKCANPGKKIVVVTFEKYKNIVESYDSPDQVVFIPSGGG